LGQERSQDLIARTVTQGWKRVQRFAIFLPHSCHSLPGNDWQFWDDYFFKVGTRSGLIPVLEVFDLPAPYQPFNPVFQGQLSGDDFTNSSTRQEPDAALQEWTVSGSTTEGRRFEG
jgi:hypothetical protein